MNVTDVGNGTFPIQKLPLSKKTQEWKEQSLDALIVREFSAADKENMKINYDLYNGIFDESDFKYVTNPYKVDEGFPASVKNFNIIKPKVDLLIGEASKRPRNFVVFQSNDETASAIQNQAKELLLDYITEVVTLRASGQEPSQEQLQEPSEIHKFLKEDYVDIAENIALHSLNYLNEYLDLDNEFLMGFKDGLIADHEIYYTGIINGEPLTERVNPLTFSYDRTSSTGFIEEGDWALRADEMTPAEIYDRFYDTMEEKDLDKILTMFNENITSKASEVNTPYVKFRNISNLNNLDDGTSNYETPTVTVYHAVWRSFKKIGFLTSTDPDTGEDITEMVDETYKPSEGESVKWDWIIEIWEGYKAGDVYLDIKPVEYQETSLDNPNAKKLPYTGIVYNNTNTVSKSLVETMKSLQYMYIVIWYRLELALARDKGKALAMDVTQIPKSMGVDVEKFMHYLSAMGVAFFNPYECFAPGTKVIMGDGKLKNIEEIEIGDKVLGPDGSVRNVINTHNDVDNMYRLNVKTGGNDQIVNSSHKIYYKQKNYYKNENIEKLDNPVNLLKEDAELPYIEHTRYLERSTEFSLNWNSELLLDPYLLGVWLGDGSSNSVAITNIDPEIASYLQGYAEENNMFLSVDKTYNGSEVLNYRLINKENKNNRGGNNQNNQFLDSLRYYNVLNNKHIPNSFIYTSVENRLKILAGLIDTDGYYSCRDNYYVFSQCESRKHLVEQAAFIARSLGFKCTVSKYIGEETKYICNSEKISICQPTYTLRILSWDKEIPVKIERKKAICNENKLKDSNLSNFRISYEGIGEFYGIEIDGDNLFLLSDFTIVHNSEMADIPGRQGHPASYNQFSSIDLSMANVIAGYVDLMAKIEEMIGEISGVTRQRQGSISNYELVGNVERSVIQSSHITENLFWKHNQVIKRTLTYLLNTAKYAWKQSGKKKLHYIMSDATRAFLDVTEDFLYSDFDIFLSDSTKEQQNIESLKSLLQPAMQNGASLMEAASIITSNNVNGIKRRLQDIEERKQQAEQRAEQQAAELQRQQAEAESAFRTEEMQMKREELEQENLISLRDNETKITVAEIQASSKDNITDNSLDQQKLELQREKQQAEIRIKEQNLQEDRRSNKADEELKARQIRKSSNTTNK